MIRGALLLLLSACLLPSSWAQYEEDDQTADYANRDRQYQQRRAEKKPAPINPDSGRVETASEAFLAKAESLVKDKNYRAASSERYRVQSDDPRVDAKAAVALLDAFGQFFDQYWEQQLHLDPYDKQSRVFLFFSFYKYNQLLGTDFRFSQFRPQGHYGAHYDAICLHSDTLGPRGTAADALVHEATHQLIAQRLMAGRRIPALWLSEGLASYFGFTYMGKDGFIAGELGGKATSLFRGGPERPGDEAAVRLKTLRRRLKKLDGECEAPFLDTLVRLEDPAIFYGSDPETHYAASWLLTHLLLDGAEGRFRAPFISFLNAGRESIDALDAETLYKSLGVSAAELQQAFQAHVKKVKSR